MAPAQKGGRLVDKKFHECPAVSCRRKIEVKFLMCQKHWFMLPKGMRESLWHHYKNGQNEGRVAPNPEWVRTLEQATMLIEEAEDRQGVLFDLPDSRLKPWGNDEH